MALKIGLETEKWQITFAPIFFKNKQLIKIFKNENKTKKN